MSDNQQEQQKTRGGLLATSRWDIEILRALIVLGGLLMVLNVLTGINGFRFGSDGVALDRSDGTSTMEVGLLPSDLTIEHLDGFQPEVVLGMAAVSGSARTTYVVSGLVLVVGIFVIGASGFMILTDAAKGDPFVARNTRRWQVIAAGFLIIGLANIVRSLAEAQAKDLLGLVPSGSLTFGWIIPIFVAGAMARVWNAGVQMREEQQMTI